MKSGKKVLPLALEPVRHSLLHHGLAGSYKVQRVGFQRVNFGETHSNHFRTGGSPISVDSLLRLTSTAHACRLPSPTVLLMTPVIDKGRGVIYGTTHRRPPSAA